MADLVVVAFPTEDHTKEEALRQALAAHTGANPVP